MVLWYSKFIISRINRFNRRCGDCGQGFGVLHYQGFTKIIIVLIISPIIAFCVGFIMYTTVKIVFKMLTLLERIVISDSSKYSETAIVLTWYERCTKSMGIITLALIVANIQDPTNVEPVLWVKLPVQLQWV